MEYGLIGEKLGHSYSKLIHRYLTDYTYDLQPLSREEFREFMKKKDFKAINVTIPYKQEVIPYLYEMDSRAKDIGAVNTIVNKCGHLYGYNTDFYGFEYMLKHNSIEISGKKVLVLGDGGAAKAVRAVLAHLNASGILTVSRKAASGAAGVTDSAGSAAPPPVPIVTTECQEVLSACPCFTPAVPAVTTERQTILAPCPCFSLTVPAVTYEVCYKNHTDAQIIVNTTPVGMYPEVDASPLNLDTFTSCEAVVDLIYNPSRTRLARQAEELGIKAVTGLEMLVAQAKQAAEYFLDTKIDEAVIDEIYKKMLETL